MPPAVLYAVSLAESATTLPFGRRPWPWTLNIAGRGARYATRKAACRALQTALTHTRSVDVGIAQINVRWQPGLFGAGERFAAPCAALDPYANLDAAAALLRRCHERTAGGWSAAAGCYHRPAGGAPAARYRAAFTKELTRLTRGGSLELAGRTPNPAASPRAADEHPPAPRRAAVAADPVTWINPSTDEEERNALD